MSSIFNGNIKISIFGESHGPMIGAVIDNIPAGEKIDFKKITLEMSRRAPGTNDTATSRIENDNPSVVSGILNGYTTGAPICALIENNDVKSDDYKNISHNIRPGHADYTAHVKYNGFGDLKGGGHLSGRLTASLTFCGAVCRQLLEHRGVIIGSHIYSISDIFDTPFDGNISDDLLKSLPTKKFPLIDNSIKEKMVQKILSAKNDGDSIGGIIECAINNVPAGIGSPIFYGIENKIASLIFSVPGIKGIEFGAGFRSTTMTGSQHNDEFTVNNGKISTVTNNHGGILGGISSGMPIVFRCAVKPTPSIAKLQNTVDIVSRQPTTLSVTGRHDPCIVPRAVPVVDSIASIALVDLFKEANLL